MNRQHPSDLSSVIEAFARTELGLALACERVVQAVPEPELRDKLAGYARQHRRGVDELSLWMVAEGCGHPPRPSEADRGVARGLSRDGSSAERAVLEQLNEALAASSRYSDRLMNESEVPLATRNWIAAHRRREEEEQRWIRQQLAAQ